ncbi:MAG: hypothetical protein ACLUDU_18615, partial [Butyricimonas faecihominis]
MNFIFIEALYEFKSTCRNILFYIFIFLAVLGLLIYQFTALSRMSDIDSISYLFEFYMDWSSQALSSSIPFKSAFYFNIIQLFLVIGFTINDLRTTRLSAMIALQVRPQENYEIVMGRFLGRFLVITLVNWLSFLISIVLNIVYYPRSFELSYYFFYWSTFLLPALIYYLGVSYLVTRITRNQGISMIILLLFLGGIIYWGAGFFFGVLDPSSRNIPNMFSDFTGHVNLGNYLLQRGSILLTGVAFVCLSIIPLGRIPNYTRLPRRSACISFVLFLLTGCLAFMYYDRNETVNVTRKLYKLTYDKYAEFSGARVMKHDLYLKELENGNISVNSKMTVVNQSSKETPLIVYLNPGLKIISAEINGREGTFERENQVLYFNRKLQPDECCDLQIKYEGNIENEICFIDVPPVRYNSSDVNTLGIYKYGYKPAFCEKKYKLLTPECIWYPVCVPPYSLTGGRNVNFTRYSLTVEHDPNLTAISQGSSIKGKEGKSYFTFNHDMPGISLSIGNYKRRSITIDSTRFDLYCLPK